MAKGKSTLDRAGTKQLDWQGAGVDAIVRVNLKLPKQLHAKFKRAVALEGLTIQKFLYRYIANNVDALLAKKPSE